MTNKHTAQPWIEEDNGLSEYMIVDSDNDIVDYVAAAGDEDSAKLIANSVNYHHRLREALRDVTENLEYARETGLDSPHRNFKGEKS